MSFTLSVDADAWRAHLTRSRDAIEQHPATSLVPVVKGNGYGLGQSIATRAAAGLGAEVVDPFGTVPEKLAHEAKVPGWSASGAGIRSPSIGSRRVAITASRTPEPDLLVARPAPRWRPSRGGLRARRDEATDPHQGRCPPGRHQPPGRRIMAKIADLRAKSDDQLVADLADLKKEAFNLRFQRVSGQLENTARVRAVRRDIARIKTILGEKTAQSRTQAAG